VASMAKVTHRYQEVHRRVCHSAFCCLIWASVGPCGMRGAEITGLEVDALDFDACEIDITQQLVYLTGQAPYLGPPKTRTSVRTIEAPAVTMAALARHIKRYPPVEVEIWDRTDPDKRKHHRRIARLIFTTIEGRPIYRATWALIWAPAARKAGIPKGMGLHSLRHYFATLLIHSGQASSGSSSRSATPRPRSPSTPTWGSGQTQTGRHAQLSTRLSAVCPDAP
jgi:integrase